MGRSPQCSDKTGIKKGPWTPEEDIILASYIQQHGQGNWKSVPTNTGLLRCSKSCRLRWTNYLRPGIKRGNFTPHEERIIIHLQSSLGNKWAAIASYLPQRTDNDIKNYWNTHLKKKINKFQSPSSLSFHPIIRTSTSFSLLTDMTHLHQHQISANTSTYASSTENISRLLQGWMKSPPNSATTTVTHEEKLISSAKVEEQSCAKVEEQNCEDHLISHEEFESLLSFDENISNIAWDQNKSSSSNDTITYMDEKVETMSTEGDQQDDQGLMEENQPSFCLLEKWLLDEATTASQVLEEMELSPMF